MPIHCGMKITLTRPDIERAAEIGVRRHIEAIIGGYLDHAVRKDNGWTIHIEGAAGELALALWLGVPWDGDVNTFKSKPDVASLEVRTRLEDTWDLIIRKADTDDAIYVLLTGKVPTFDIRGWIWGRDARRREWLQNYGGYGVAHFVPQSALHPMSELPPL